MAAVSGTRWPITPHTRAKHLILKRHLDAWLPIMTHVNSQLLFIDGFAGPGRYEGGEAGSPIIALKAAILNRRFQQTPPRCDVQFVFIEEDSARVAALRGELETFTREHPLPSWVSYEVELDEFAPYLSRELDRLAREGRRPPSTFAFIDPFGYSDVSMSLIGRIRQIPSSECLINFAYKSMNRWAAGDPTRERHLDELFGTSGWRQYLGNEQELVHLYRRQLVSEAGFRYVRTFQMRGSLDVTEYFLAFCTNSLKGLSVFKQAAWKADPTTGRIFSDASDPNQLLLVNPLPPLRDLLLSRFRGEGWIDIAQVTEYVLVETDYSEMSHLKKRTLGRMEGEGPAVLSVERPVRKRKRAGEYPDGTRLRFGD
jgi:three-Cys-motif partner protein